jgi:hypothetical protein
MSRDVSKIVPTDAAASAAQALSALIHVRWSRNS